MRSAVSLIALFVAAGAASAQTVTHLDQSQAMGQLNASASGDFGAVADGSHESSDGTTVVGVAKGQLVKVDHIDHHRSCTMDVGADPGSTPHGGAARTCEDVPASTIKTYADRETVHITDRDKYVSHQGTKWMLIGGGIGAAVGALAFLSLLIPGVGTLAGVLIGVGGMVAGAVAGGAIGRSVARSDAKSAPDTFTRDTNKKEVVTYP